MLERNKVIQQPTVVDCISPEPVKTNVVVKSLSGTNLENIIDENVKNTNGHLERQSTSSASGISTPSSNSREDNEKYTQRFSNVLKLH